MNQSGMNQSDRQNSREGSPFFPRALPFNGTDHDSSNLFCWSPDSRIPLPQPRHLCLRRKRGFLERIDADFHQMLAPTLRVAGSGHSTVTKSPAEPLREGRQTLVIKLQSTGILPPAMTYLTATLATGLPTPIRGTGGTTSFWLR